MCDNDDTDIFELYTNQDDPRVCLDPSDVNSFDPAGTDSFNTNLCDDLPILGPDNSSDWLSPVHQGHPSVFENDASTSFSDQDRGSLSYQYPNLQPSMSSPTMGLNETSTNDQSQINYHVSQTPECDDTSSTALLSDNHHRSSTIKPRLLPRTIAPNRSTPSEANLNFHLEQNRCGNEKSAEKGDSKPSGKTAGFYRFRVALPEAPGRSEMKPEQRLNRKSVSARGGQCLPCKFLKKQCSPGLPCARCVERTMGRIDLGFTLCLRDHPCKFNPFDLGTKDSPNQINVESISSPVMKYLYKVYCNANPKGFSMVHPWLFVNAFEQAAGRFRFYVGIKDQYNPELPRAVLSLVSKSIFNMLEISLRERASHQEFMDSVLIAAWLCVYIKSEKMNSITDQNSEAIERCKNYLLCYAVRGMAPISRQIRQIFEKAEDRLFPIIVEIAASMMKHSIDCCWIPETALSLVLDVEAGKYAHTFAEAWQTRGSASTTAMYKPSAQCPMHILKDLNLLASITAKPAPWDIWARFATAIPANVRAMMNYEWDDLWDCFNLSFEEPIEGFSWDTNERGWGNWMAMIIWFRQTLGIAITVVSGMVSNQEADDLNAHLAWIRAPEWLYRRELEGKKSLVSERLCCWFRWMVLLCLTTTGLLRETAVDLLVLRSAPPRLLQRFGTIKNFELALNVLKVIAKDLEELKTSPNPGP